jgi:hypothetical protein
LRNLLHLTNKLVKKVIKHAPIEILAVKIFSQDDGIAEDHGKKTRKHGGTSESAAKKKERKRSHTSLRDLD